MVCNDNDPAAPGAARPRQREDGLGQFDELSLSGGSASVALGLVTIDAAHSLSLAMHNAVVEQQNGWTMQRAVTAKAVHQMLRNDVGDRAVDLLLGLLRHPGPTAS